ncbi:MAG: serine/threonine protein kinase, partial [Myxococcales bacterium]
VGQPLAAPSVPDADEAQERRAAADPLVGMVVAERYRILSVLGVGGMGVVYKVEHVHIGKLMAMKLLSGALSRDPVVIKRFKREALAASRLSHPNTVQVFDFGQANNLTYLVMELVPGEDLARVLRLDGPLTVGRVVRLMVQVCGSLAEAHAAGIVHRDLKPENVLLVRSRDGKDELPKVCDFGVAKLRGSAADGTNDATQDRAVVGTPYYMAPEQIRGEEVDARADVYAIGAMMYRLLTGQPPFEGPSPMAVFAKHLTESPRPLSERAPDLGIPRSIDALVLRAMAKNRDDRFASVEAMQVELFDVLRAGNTSSVDLLVDAGHIERLAAHLTLGSSPSQPAMLVRKTATRDEVAAYERKLNRQRRLGQVLLGGALLGGLVTLGVLARQARGYVEAQALPAVLPEGIENEPNDDAARANRVAFGREVRGQIGKRLAPDRSDRDFFAFDVPAGVDRAQLRLTALPNFATCLWLYRSGTADPLARFCSGAPRQDFTLPSYLVEPGRYLLAVLQDTDGHGADSPPV